MHSHERYISELFRLGASGYLLKSAAGTDIVNAIQASLKGETYLSPSISNKVVEGYISIKKASHQEDRYNRLSNREREVFQMIAEGRSTKQIAENSFYQSEHHQNPSRQHSWKSLRWTIFHS